MKHNIIQSFLSVALLAAAICAPAQSFLDVADASLDALREGREQNAAPADVRAIFAKAKAAADEDDKLNLCGFYTGMSAADARALVAHYALKPGEWSTEGDPVYKIYLSLKGVRRVTKGGNTFDELAQAVANRVGSLKQDWETKVYSLKTIDGIVVTISESSGFSMFEESVRFAKPKSFKTEVVTITDGIELSLQSVPGGLWFGKTEVTQAQWEAVMGSASRFNDRKGANNPAVYLSWNDCQDFLKKLNDLPAVKKSGLVFRLPTQEEWEHACRAGATGKYCKLADGTEITEETLGRVAWFKDNSENQMHPVCQKEPNAWGLYDMLGNVEEWTSTANAEGEYYFSGGSWVSKAEWCCEPRWKKPSWLACTGFRLCASGGAD